MSARSYLFVPGDCSERFDKACASGADAVIFDREDAVRPECKGEACEGPCLTRRGRGRGRLNGTDTAWFDDDCSQLDTPGLLDVSLSKAETAEQLRRLAERLPEQLQMLPIAETASGSWNAGELAAAPEVERLAFGSVNFQVDTGIAVDGQELLSASSRQVQPINNGLLPAPEQVTWAKKVMAIVEAHQGVGAISLNGKLIDLPVILRARRILKSAVTA